jgi:hypothetical protein
MCDLWREQRKRLWPWSCSRGTSRISFSTLREKFDRGQLNPFYVTTALGYFAIFVDGVISHGLKTCLSTHTGGRVGYWSFSMLNCGWIANVSKCRGWHAYLALPTLSSKTVDWLYWAIHSHINWKICVSSAKILERWCGAFWSAKSFVTVQTSSLVTRYVTKLAFANIERTVYHTTMRWRVVTLMMSYNGYLLYMVSFSQGLVELSTYRYLVVVLRRRILLCTHTPRTRSNSFLFRLTWCVT